MNLADRILALEQWARELERRIMVIADETQALEAARRQILADLGPAVTTSK
jgi:hypothetical protein